MIEAASALVLELPKLHNEAMDWVCDLARALNERRDTPTGALVSTYRRSRLDA